VKFENRQAFPFSRQAVWDQLFSEAYDQALSAGSEMDKQVIEEGTREGRRFRRTRLTSRKPVPAAMAAFTGPQLSYDLIEIYANNDTSLDWKVIPSTAADKVKAEGSYAVVDTPAGCERVVKGEIVVSVPLIGGKIEKGIGEQLEASYQRSSAFAATWMKQKLA
jgi:hypothetical protein